MCLHAFLKYDSTTLQLSGVTQQKEYILDRKQFVAVQDARCEDASWLSHLGPLVRVIGRRGCANQFPLPGQLVQVNSGRGRVRKDR